MSFCYMLLKITNINRRFFPPIEASIEPITEASTISNTKPGTESTLTTAEHEEGWEEVKGVKAEESAENGAAELAEDKKCEETDKVTDVTGNISVVLPDVPQVDPADDGPALKKHKPNVEEVDEKI